MSTRMTLEGGNIQPNSRGDGDKIGILTKIEQFGSADVYEVTLEQGTVNFTAIKEVFSYVDVKKGVINLKGYIFSRICVYN